MYTCYNVLITLSYVFWKSTYISYSLSKLIISKSPIYFELLYDYMINRFI